MRKTRIAILMALLALAGLAASLIPGTAQADGDWYVNPGESIQSAIDAAFAAGGGTVHVSAGTYYELISLKSGVAVMGVGADVTIINGDTDGNGTGNGTVVMAIDVDSTARLEGFTITNGNGTNGGGMFVDHSSVTVANCTFTDNSAPGGSGMFNHQSSPTVTNCTFFNNSARAGSGMANAYSSPIVTNCTFLNNSASEDGGGMCNNESTPMITNCTFSGNSAGRYGGGMSNWSSLSPLVINCVFYNNSASYGGGVSNSTSSPTVTNCTFSHNSSTYGGGMINHGSLPTVTNCVLWGDTPDEIFNDWNYVIGSPPVTYSDVQMGSGVYQGSGNINEDPLFTNAAGGDFRLQSNSPCIDKGSNSAPSLPSTDMEGQPRIMDGDGNGTTIVDMGADEYPSSIPPIPEFGPLLLMGIGLMALGGFLWFKRRKQVCMSIVC